MDSFTPAMSEESRKLEAPEDMSAFKFYSMALVVETPPSFPEWNIKVTPIETIPTQDSGDTKKEEVTYTQSHPDLNGSYDSQKDVKRDNVMEVEWLPFSDSNRPTPPCVYRDETVMLFKFADVQKYYWATIKHEPKLRRKEMVRWAASNETRPLVPYTRDTSYFFELDALKKHLEIATPRTGEGVAYRIKMDVENGQMDITDDKGNNILINTEEGAILTTATIKLVHSAGTAIDHEAGDVYRVKAPRIILDGDVSITKSLTVVEGIKSGGSGEFQTDVVAGASVKAPQIIYNSLSSGASGSPAPAQADQYQRAQSKVAPSWGNTDVDTRVTKAVTPAEGAKNHPSVATDKGYSTDSAATANASTETLTGDPVVDAPVIAATNPPVTFTLNIPTLPSVKEVSAQIAQVGALTSQITGGLSAGLQNLTANLSSIQGAVQNGLSGLPSVSSITGQVGGLMDTVNQVTRQATSFASGVTGTVNQVTSQVSGLTSGVSGMINQATSQVSVFGSGLSGQITSFTSNITSQANGALRAVNGISSQVNSATSSVNSIASAGRALTTSVASAANSASAVISNLNYAANSVTAGFAAATNTVATVQAEAASASQQLAGLAQNQSAFYDPYGLDD